ncbi:MAG: hypothetical protein ABWZ83_07485 [Mesorhizobium sp.]
MTTTQPPIGGSHEPGGKDPWLMYLPAAWTAIVMALSAYGLLSSWPLFFGDELPESIAYFIYANAAASVVVILCGLYVLALALGRSPRFPRVFIFWQIVGIAWILLSQAYVLIVPDFGFSLEVLARVGVEIAIGLFCIQLARNAARDTVSATSSATTDAAATRNRPSLVVRTLVTMFGVVVGGTLGLGAGLLAGLGIVEFTDMSCFEGACGYFAVFFAFAAMLVGAIAGGIFAFWRAGRQRSQPT